MDQYIKAKANRALRVSSTQMLYFAMDASVLQRWRAPAVEEGKDRFANQIIGCYIQTHEMLDVICSKVKTGLLFVPIERLFTKRQESFSFAIE
jgi:hypothetical protein